MKRKEIKATRFASILLCAILLTSIFSFIATALWRDGHTEKRITFAGFKSLGNAVAEMDSYLTGSLSIDSLQNDTDHVLAIDWGYLQIKNADGSPNYTKTVTKPYFIYTVKGGTRFILNTVRNINCESMVKGTDSFRMRIYTSSDSINWTEQNYTYATTTNNSANYPVGDSYTINSLPSTAKYIKVEYPQDHNLSGPNDLNNASNNGNWIIGVTCVTITPADDVCPKVDFRTANTLADITNNMSGFSAGVLSLDARVDATRKALIIDWGYLQIKNPDGTPNYTTKVANPYFTYSIRGGTQFTLYSVRNNNCDKMVTQTNLFRFSIYTSIDGNTWNPQEYEYTTYQTNYNNYPVGGIYKIKALPEAANYVKVVYPQDHNLGGTNELNSTSNNGNWILGVIGVDYTAPNQDTGSDFSFFNIANPPSDCPLKAASATGETDQSRKIQKLIDYAADNGYGTIYIPKAAVKYRCDHGIMIPIDKVSVFGETSLFDFSENTDSYCFRLMSTSLYTNRISHKNTFTGISINTCESNGGNNIDATGILIDGSDIPDGYFSQDNFTIERCTVVRCNKGIEFGAHAWRVRVVDSLFMWNTHHLYQYNTADTGEDIHFEGCMFCDGGDIDIAIPIEVNFSNCSFDNLLLHFRYGCNAYFSQCHFEYGDSNPIINHPIIYLENNNVNVTLDQCVMVVNNKKFGCSPISTKTNTNNAGVVITKCMLPLDSKYYDTATFQSNGQTVQFVSGGAKVLADYNFGFGLENCDIPIFGNVYAYPGAN